MTIVTEKPNVTQESHRRDELLEAAITVFARFGYRKTSMDEVARAAHASRQGLYLHFSNKEDLFRAAVLHALQSQLKAARAALTDSMLPIETRLVQALDAWLGQHVGSMGTDTSDLVEASGLLAGSILSDHEKQFEKAVAKAIEAEPLLFEAYSRSAVTPLQVARILHASARGFKDTSRTRAAFVENVILAVRVVCAPVQEQAKKAGGNRR